MNESTGKIYNIIKDYRNDEGVAITPDDIEEWAAQFGSDADFVLNEFAHLLPQVYCSKQDATQIVRDFMNGQYKDYHFGSIEEYLQKTSFFSHGETCQTIALLFFGGALRGIIGNHCFRQGEGLCYDG